MHLAVNNTPPLWTGWAARGVNDTDVCRASCLEDGKVFPSLFPTIRRRFRFLVGVGVEPHRVFEGHGGSIFWT